MSNYCVLPDTGPRTDFITQRLSIFAPKWIPGFGVILAERSVGLSAELKPCVPKKKAAILRR